MTIVHPFSDSPEGGPGLDSGLAGNYAELAGVRLRYRWDGPPELPVLVLSNSLGTDLAMWDGQIADFTRHFRVLRYDPRGHGKSSVPKGPYNLDQLSNDALQLIDYLKVDRFYFCGLSMGGAVGQWLGIHAPDRLNRLVLSNTAAKFGTPESWKIRIDAVLQGGVKAVSSAILDRWFTARFMAQAPAIVARIRAMLEGTDTAGYVAACAAVRDTDLRESASRIFLPTLVIAGTFDTSTPPADGARLGAAIPGARYAELPAAHLSNIEAESEFNSTVLDFLLKPSQA